jgi:hypothetical protein
MWWHVRATIFSCCFIAPDFKAQEQQVEESKRKSKRGGKKMAPFYPGVKGERDISINTAARISGLNI